MHRHVALTCTAVLLMWGITRAGNTADEIIFWQQAPTFLAMSDADLDAWKARGVDGFALQTGRLRGLGGANLWTGDAAHTGLTGNDPQYALQRQIRDSRIVRRLQARGMKAYLGFYT